MRRRRWLAPRSPTDRMSVWRSWCVPVWRVSCRRAPGIPKPSSSWSGRAIAAPEHDRLSLDAAAFDAPRAGRPVGRARAVGERAVEAGERAGNDYARCQGLETLALVALAEGFVGDSVAKAHQAVGVATGSDAAWAGFVVPHMWEGTALSDADRFAEAALTLHAGRRRAERTGNVSRLPLYHWAIAELRLGAGQWDDALAEAQAGLGLVGDTEFQVGDVFAHALCAHVALHRGELGAAQAAVDEARRRLVAGPVEIGYEWMSWISALLLEATAGPAGPGQAGRNMGSDRPGSLSAGHGEGHGPYLCAWPRRPEIARVLLPSPKSWRGQRPRSGTPTARGLALRCRGLLDDDVGALVAAVEVHREGPRPYLLRRGLRKRRRCPRARRQDERGGRLAGRGDRHLRAAPSRLGPRQGPGRAARASVCEGPARLVTRRSDGRASPPTEIRVVDLVAEGLTNPEIAEHLFVSRRTVATHMEHVFQKLGHSNRVELAADAVRRLTTQERTPPAVSAPGAIPASPRSQAPARRGG